MAQTELRYISRLLTVFAAIVVPGALAMVLGLGLRLGPSLTTILAVDSFSSRSSRSHGFTY